MQTNNQPKNSRAFFNRTIHRLVRPTAKRRHPLGLSVTLLLLCLVSFYAVRVLTLKNFAAQSKSQIYEQLTEAHEALSRFDPAGAQQPLTKINTELDLLKSEANKFGVLRLATIGGWLSDRVRAIPSTLQSMLGISGTAIHIAEDAAFLKENAAQLMMTGKGEELLQSIDAFRTKLTLLASYIDELATSDLDEKMAQAVGKLRGEIAGSIEALDAIVRIIGSKEPQHLLIAFLNQSEIRPGGGFMGSYAHITVSRGSVDAIEIRDVYDPDGQLDQKLIPPEPLQAITKDWEARDANWFFDYPASARTVIQFLENSKIYSEQNIHFAGIVALNTLVLENLMHLVGPIELPEYKLTISPENFLSEVQREVESGADKKVNQPKRILKVLAPKILSELTTLDADEKAQFIETLTAHIRARDIMAYARDSVLQGFLRSRGMSGDIVSGSANVINEYLAVVNANIGGAKSDAYISQKIDFKSVINELGEITNTVTLTRKHTGAKAKEWWYRAANKNYLQLYTPLGSRMTRVAGRSRWPTLPKHEYRGYQKSPEIDAIAQTQQYNEELGVDRMIINDKTVFSAWVNTPAGTSTTAVFTYNNARILPPKSGIPYEFIFEKQSGASTTLSLSISAPPKYKWKEINRGVIEYKTDNPPGRIRIRQTLVPIE